MFDACRYYLSGTDAYRLKLLLPLTPAMLAAHEMQRLAFEQGAAQADTAQPMPQPDGPHEHGAECGCMWPSGTESVSESAAGHQKQIGEDTALANASQIGPAREGGLPKRKPGRKSKSRRN